VLCPQDGPWSGTVLRSNLTGGLPTTGDTATTPEREPAWAIQLGDGGRCLFLAGTSSIVADLRLNYECTNGLSLYGNANHSAEPWTIFGRHGTTGQLLPEPIAAIWYDASLAGR
jgi:hypothetical protein